MKKIDSDKKVKQARNILIDELLINPLGFQRDCGVQSLIDVGISFKHLRSIVKRIYDLNENQLVETSDAKKGGIGYLNKISTKQRKKKFNKKVDQQLNDGKYTRIYVEGDSWFQFPFFIKDIIDWLNRHNEFLIYSDAYGGDWITNILYEEQYITKLTTYSPDIFLISGGGNDIVGNHRLGVMVDKRTNLDQKIIKNGEKLITVKRRYSSKNEILSNSLTDIQKDQIIQAQDYLNKEFYALLLVFELQYTLMFNNLYLKDSSKHKNVISIVQGYDFGFPSILKRFSWRYPLQYFVNLFTDTGNWLSTPMMAKGIIDLKTRESIVVAIIFEFSEMLQRLAEKYENVFFIDSRGVAPHYDDWYDELHLKSHKFKQVASAFEYVIRNHGNMSSEKIVRSINFRN